MANTNKKKGKKIYWIIATFLIIVILMAIKSKDNPENEVTVTMITRGSIIEKIPANGKIQPVTEVKISPDVSGEIVELNVKEGDYVSRGDLVIKIKQDTYLSAVEQATAALNSVRAAYRQQEAQYRKAEQNFERNRRLYELRTISQMEFENASAERDVAEQQLSSAKFNIASAEAQLKESKENLVKTTIYAPMDGIVSKLLVEKGERVVGTTQMAGTEMLRIADFSAMEALVDVNENDIIQLHLGDTATVAVDAYPDREFLGVVTEVANSSKNSGTAVIDQATTFEVKVRLLQDSYADLLETSATPFRPGMSASVQIQTNKVENVLLVPFAAVTTRKDLIPEKEGHNAFIAKQMVFVYDDKTQTVNVRQIKTGLQDMDNIEVKEGLSDSLWIVTAPIPAISKTLHDGSKVEVTE